MWMNSHERRVALHLRRIPRPTGGQGNVRVYSRDRLDGITRPGDFRLAGIDEEGMHAVIKTPHNSTAHVPFSFITSIWQLPDGLWSLGVRGALFDRGDPFVPYLGGA